jgi:hypothetical protein
MLLPNTTNPDAASRRAPRAGARAAAAWLAVAALAAGPSASAQTAAVLEGDPVVGVGNVTRIDNLAVNDVGSWKVEADTDNADTEADSVVLADGALELREGQTLPSPTGATLGSFDTINLNGPGNSGWNFFLDGTSGGGDDTGVYWNTTLLIQEGDVSTASPLTVGTPYLGFFECKLNDAEQILLMASIDDPAIASTTDRLLVKLVTDGAGNLVGETVVQLEGAPLAGQLVTDLETNPHAFDFNQLGQSMYIADLDGPAATNAAVAIDGLVVAQKGMPSPVAGRNWSSFSTGKVDLDDSAGYVILGLLDGDTASNTLIEVSGAKLVQEGDALFSDADFHFTSFGSGPVQIGDNGNVLWYGDWDDADTDVDTGLFLNDLLVVQEGVTTIGGLVVDNLRGIQDGYGLSPDGEWVIFEAELAGGSEGAFLIDVGPWVSLGFSKPGTDGKAPQLRGVGSLVDGSPIDVDITNGLPAGVASLVVGFSTLFAPVEGGTLVPDPTPPLGVIVPLTTGPAGRIVLNGTWPTGLPSGIELYLQYWVTDVAGPFGWSASNAVQANLP